MVLMMVCVFASCLMIDSVLRCPEVDWFDSSRAHNDMIDKKLQLSLLNF